MSNKSGVSLGFMDYLTIAHYLTIAMFAALVCGLIQCPWYVLLFPYLAVLSVQFVIMFILALLNRK